MAAAYPSRYLSRKQRSAQRPLDLAADMRHLSAADQSQGTTIVAMESVMLPLGSQAPEFELHDVVYGKTYSLNSFSDKRALLIMFICRHCPYVVHVEQELARIGHDYLRTDLGIIAISSNDSTVYPDDAPPRLKEMAERLGFTFPFCHDETQEVAKAYRAACTPDFYLFDRDRRLVYRGQLDDSRPSNGKPITGRDLRAAIQAVLDMKPVVGTQRPSIGCSIKWKPGNTPSYA